MTQEVMNIFGVDYLEDRCYLNYPGASVRFVPGYLDKNKHEYDIIGKLSEVDREDLIIFNKNVYNALTGKDLVKTISDGLGDVVAHYQTDKEFIFTDENILVGDKPLFDIKIFYGEEKATYIDNKKYPYAGLNVGINIYCYTGIGNVLIGLSPELNKKIALWLNDYLFKRLEEEIFVKTDFFRDYWLNRH